MLTTVHNIPDTRTQAQMIHCFYNRVNLKKNSNFV